MDPGSLRVDNYAGCYKRRAEQLRDVLLAKLNAKMPAPKKPNRFSLPVMWEELKPRYAAERLDLEGALCNAVIKTEAFAQEARRLFSPLREVGIVLELPDYNTSRVYENCSHWAFPRELFGDALQLSWHYEPAKGLMTRFLSLVLFWFASDSMGWYPEVVRGAANLLAGEGERRDISAEEAVAGFEALARVEGSRGITSMPNMEVADAPALLVRDWDALEADLQRELENLALEAMGDAEAKLGGLFP